MADKARKRRPWRTILLSLAGLVVVVSLYVWLQLRPGDSAALVRARDRLSQIQALTLTETVSGYGKVTVYNTKFLAPNYFVVASPTYIHMCDGTHHIAYSSTSDYLEIMGPWTGAGAPIHSMDAMSQDNIADYRVTGDEKSSLDGKPVQKLSVKVRYRHTPTLEHMLLDLRDVLLARSSYQRYYIDPATGFPLKTEIGSSSGLSISCTVDKYDLHPSLSPDDFSLEKNLPPSVAARIRAKFAKHIASPMQKTHK